MKSRPTKAGTFGGIKVLDVYAVDPMGNRDDDLDTQDWAEQWDQAKTWIRVVTEAQTFNGHQWVRL